MSLLETELLQLMCMVKTELFRMIVVLTVIRFQTTPDQEPDGAPGVPTVLV
jgi:hypothetical protein